MKLLEGKKAAIFGVANERSIAWAIAEAFHAEGAELAFTYAGEVLEKRVRPLAESVGSKIILPCDVTKDAEVEKVFADLRETWGGLDILIHAIAFANKEDLANDEDLAARFAGIEVLFISARDHTHVDLLKKQLVDKVIKGSVDTENVIITNARHYEALQQVAASLTDIKKGLDEKIPGDLIALDIRRCLHYLGEITGEISNEDMLDYIFSKFCIGK